MDPLIGSALISAGSGLAQSLFGIGKTKRNKQLMEHELSLNKKMFDYQNAYNTPKNQMKRLTEAGLNPALMYGQGTTGNATNAPQTRYTPQETFDSTSMISGLQQGAQMLLQKQQTNNLKAQEQETNSRTLLNSIEAAIKGGTQEEAKGLIRYQLENLKEENKTKKQNLANMKINEDILNHNKSKAQTEAEDAKIKKAMNQIDLDHMQKTKISRLDPTIIKILWRAAKGGQDLFKSLLFDFMRSQGLGFFIERKGID